MTILFWAPFLASLLAAAVTTAGLVVIRRFEAWGRGNTTYFACFAAGVLISVSFLHIVPTAFSMATAAPGWLLAGYVVMHLLNRFLSGFVCDRPETADYAIGLIPLLGIGFHSFIDGAIYAITFKVSLFTGVLAAAGMVLHEFPEGIVTYLLLLKGGFSKSRALLLAFVTAALTTPLGAIAAYPVVERIDAGTLGAGARAFLGGADLCRHHPSPAAGRAGAETLQPDRAGSRYPDGGHDRREQGITGMPKRKVATTL